MQALILANGKGTNLRPLTVYTPKPILPVLNVPLLLYQIEILKRAGANQITLFLDYQPGKIEHLLGSEEELGVELRYVVESQPLGTAGAYKFASKYSRERTIVLNGDILTDMVIAKLISRHEASKSLFSIALTPYEARSKYGLVRTDEQHMVTEYLPDPEVLEAPGFEFMNAGVYIVEPEISDMILDDTNLTFKHDVFPGMVERKEPLFGFSIPGHYWCGIDTLEKYLTVQTDLLDGKARNFRKENGKQYERATSAFIDDRSIIGPGCVIKSNAHIINSVLGKGVQVEERAVVENSVIWSHTKISNSAVISGSIIAGSCYIGKNVTVSKGSVLADKTTLPDYTKV